MDSIMGIVVITISIIAVGSFGCAMWLLSEYKRLSTENRTLSTKNGTLSTDLVKEEKKSENLQIKLDSADDQIKRLETDRAKVSGSNANALWRLHLAQVSLKAGAVSLHAERAKSDQLTGIYQNLIESYRSLYNEHRDLIDESQRRANERLARSGIKLGLNLVPLLGAILEAGEIIESVIDAGEAVSESSDILSALESAMDKFDISGDFSGSVELPVDSDITEEVQSAYTETFDLYLTDPEKLEASDLRAFATDAIQRTGDVPALESLVKDEDPTAILNIFASFAEFGIEYYDYHKIKKLEPPEDATDSDKAA